MPISGHVGRRGLIAGLAASPWLGLASAWADPSPTRTAVPFSGIFQGQAHVPAGAVLDVGPGPIRSAVPLVISVWLADPQPIDRRFLGSGRYAFQVSVQAGQQGPHVLRSLVQVDQRLTPRAGERLKILIRNLSTIDLDLGFRILPAAAQGGPLRG